MRWLRLLEGDGDGGGDGGGGSHGGGDQPTFLDSLPEDIRNHPSIVAADIKDAVTMANSFINAQKLIGTDKIALPKEDWTDEQWAEFYTKTGRPEESEGYNPFDEAVMKEIGMSEDGAKEMRKAFHDAGLSTRQATVLADFYMKQQKEGLQSYRDAQERERQETENSLRNEFGENYDMKLEIAQGVVREFGSEELGNVLEVTGLGNNAHVIRFLAKVGSMFVEDDARGAGKNLIVTSETEAKQEIELLKMDSDFQKKLSDRLDPGHKEAVARWSALYSKAFPGVEKPV